MHYQIQQLLELLIKEYVVISFKISIFALSNTTLVDMALWEDVVVISFKISIFALSNTTTRMKMRVDEQL